MKNFNFVKAEKNNFNHYLIKILIIYFSIIFLHSCGSDDPYLYDRTGFESDGRPIVAPNPNAINTSNPSYYQPIPSYGRQPSYQQNYQQPSYQQPNYQPQPYPQSGYPQQYGGSRYYNDPYAIPPSQYYPRYDSDQYYAPPNYYYNVEQSKFRTRSTNSSAF